MLRFRHTAHAAVTMALRLMPPRCEARYAREQRYVADAPPFAAAYAMLFRDDVPPKPPLRRASSADAAPPLSQRRFAAMLRCCRQPLPAAIFIFEAICRCRHAPISPVFFDSRLRFLLLIRTPLPP
jgi:hypothetical protein